MTLRTVIVAAVAALLASTAAAPAHAHGVGWTREDSAATFALRFVYSSGEAMAFAAVSVSMPDGTVFQKGRADREGRFAFVPNGPGEWRVHADDGTGHALDTPITVEEKISTPSATPSGTVHTTAWISTSRPVAVILGLSLIANLFGGLMLWRRVVFRPRS